MGATEFLGMNFTPMALSAALDRVVARAEQTGFSYVATANVDHVVRHARAPGRFGPLYARADLTLNDSRVLERMAEASGLALPAAPGADLTEALFSRVIRPDEPIVVIGGSAATIDGLKRRYGLSRVRWHAPPMGLADDPAAVAAAAAFIAANPARFVFIAVGSPQQEIVAHAALQRGDCRGVALCIGGSLDFLAGVKRRAPRWMRVARAEWAFRLMCEPRRLAHRYLVDGPAVFALWADWSRRASDAGKVVASGAAAISARI
jgi:exopolysaccharide biosynthesis WecB/TagA/CpsF family protein